jgi:hypothetical protein
MTIGRRHTKATKDLAKAINRQDRRRAKAQLAEDFDAVMNYQPRGRALWLSY